MVTNILKSVLLLFFFFQTIKCDEISKDDSGIPCIVCTKKYHAYACLGMSRSTLKTFKEVPGLLCKSIDEVNGNGRYWSEE